MNITLNPNLKYNLNWYLFILGLKPTPLSFHSLTKIEMKADTLSMEIGGNEAIEGAVTLLAKENQTKKAKAQLNSP